MIDKLKFWIWMFLFIMFMCGVVMFGLIGINEMIITMDSHWEPFWTEKDSNTVSIVAWPVTLVGGGLWCLTTMITEWWKLGKKK